MESFTNYSELILEMYKMELKGATKEEKIKLQKDLLNWLSENTYNLTAGLHNAIVFMKRNDVLDKYLDTCDHNDLIMINTMKSFLDLSFELGLVKKRVK